MQVVFYNPYLKKVPQEKLKDELFLSKQGGVFVWSALANFYLNKSGYKSIILDYIPKEEAVIIFHPRFTKFLKKEKNLKNKILVSTLADARNKLKFVDYHIVQNPFQEDKYSLFVPHFPQPMIIPRNKKEIENIVFKGEKQNLMKEIQTKEFKNNLKQAKLSFIIDNDKEKWRDYSYVDIVLAVRPYDKNLWIKKPFTKILNAWIAKTPIIVGKEIGSRYLKKSDLDFIEVQNLSDLYKAIKRLKTDKVLYEEMVLNGIERQKEFSIDKIVQKWVTILDYIKTNPNKSIKTKLYKNLFLRGF